MKILKMINIKNNLHKMNVEDFCYNINILMMNGYRFYGCCGWQHKYIHFIVNFLRKLKITLYKKRMNINGFFYNIIFSRNFYDRPEYKFFECNWKGKLSRIIKYVGITKLYCSIKGYKVD